MGVVDILVVVILMLLPFWYFSKRKGNSKRIEEAVEKFNGAPRYPILGTAWTQFTTPKKDLFEKLHNRHKIYGPVFRSWVGSRPLIHITKAEHAEVILRSNTNITKAVTYDFLRPWLGQGLITASGQHWQKHRKLLTPTFHFKILDTFQETFSEKAGLLCEELKPLANGKFFDIYSYITYCALDIICETAMGVQINAMQHHDSDYVKAIYRMSKLPIYRWFRPWLHPDFIFKRTAAGKEQQKILDTLHGFADKVIEDRKVIIKNSTPLQELSEEDKLMGKKRKLAFLDLLLQYNLEENRMSDEEIREEVDTFMFAGHDTTTASVGWTLFSLGNYPEIQNKVYQEVMTVLHGEDRPITPEDVMNLQYTERVLKEAMRIYSIVPSITRLLTEDIELDGKLVPAGVTIAIHVTTLHKDPEQFPDPLRFDPDRFLPENISKRSPYAYMPFSAGPRNCLGQKFAIRNAKTMIATIIKNYEVKSQLKPDEMEFLGDIILRPAQGISVSLNQRVE